MRLNDVSWKNWSNPGTFGFITYKKVTRITILKLDSIIRKSVDVEQVASCLVWLGLPACLTWANQAKGSISLSRNFT